MIRKCIATIEIQGKLCDKVMSTAESGVSCVIANDLNRKAKVTKLLKFEWENKLEIIEILISFNEQWNCFS